MCTLGQQMVSTFDGDRSAALKSIKFLIASRRFLYLASLNNKSVPTPVVDFETRPAAASIIDQSDISVLQINMPSWTEIVGLALVDTTIILGLEALVCYSDDNRTFAGDRSAGLKSLKSLTTGRPFLFLANLNSKAIRLQLSTLRHVLGRFLNASRSEKARVLTSY